MIKECRSPVDTGFWRRGDPPNEKNMIKKIQTEELRLGMFIHDLNCGWMGHSFFRTRFPLKKEEDLRKILESGIREVYIDTGKGLDAQGPTQDEAVIEVSKNLLESASPAPPAPSQTSHVEELTKALRIQSEANQMVHSLLSDVRLGKQIKVDQVEPVIEQITDSILRNQGTLVSLGRIKARDNYTFQHSVSVATLMVSFCRYMEMDRAQIQEAGIGAILHDVGKMVIPDHILNKPGKLTDIEFAVMKSHVPRGLEILQQTPGISATALQIAGEHHERFGGSGYPNDLKGQEISKLGRMAAIVDVYDAITSNRVYHTGMEPPIALQKLFEWSKFHFDEELVQHFIQSIGIYPVGSLVRLESQRIAVVVQQGESGLLFPLVRVVFDIRTRSRIQPVDLDLSKDHGGGDAIVGGESPEYWGINPFDFLILEL